MPLIFAWLLTLLVIAGGLFFALLGSVTSGAGHDAVDRGPVGNLYAALAPLLVAGILVRLIWRFASGRRGVADIAVSTVLAIALASIWYATISDSV